MEKFNIDMPTLTGKYELGLAIINKLSLSNDKKLPILMAATGPADIDMVKQNALLWAYGQFTDQTARSMFCNGVSGILDAGFICTIRATGLPDGDWFQTVNTIPANEAQKAAIQAIVNEDAIHKVLNIAVTTKVNYWVMNHHTGQNQVAGYVKKVLQEFYPNAVTNQVVSAAHNFGRFCSTLKILTLAGIAHIRPATSYVSSGSNFNLSEDLKLRFKSMPAGTRRLETAFNSAKRLLRNAYSACCPNIEDFKDILNTREKILQEPAKYHIEAFYLSSM